MRLQERGGLAIGEPSSIRKIRDGGRSRAVKRRREKEKSPKVQR